MDEEGYIERIKILELEAEELMEENKAMKQALSEIAYYSKNY
jgi:FtsZ-binding cell division protein ZapB